MPKLSIILTCRDKFELLRLAVASVFEQTFTDWELIIVDDASEDQRVHDYLNKVEANIDAVRVFRGREVTGSYRKKHKMNAIRINAALHMARGEYISYLGDDNVYLPERCGRMVRLLNKEPEIGIVVDRVRWMMFDGREADQDEYTYKYIKPYEEGHEELLRAIAPSTYICTDSVTHRVPPRKCCREWPTDVQSHTPVDWRYWLYLVTDAKFKVKKIDAVGERAYFPGTWRHGITVEQAMRMRRDLPISNDRRREMPSIAKVRAERIKDEKRKKKKGKRADATDPSGKVWCVNTSGCLQQISNTAFPKPIKVPPGGRIEEEFVRIPGGIFPGFSYDSRIAAPPMKRVLEEKPKQPAGIKYERVKMEELEDETVPPPPPEPLAPLKVKRIKIEAKAEDKTPFEGEAGKEDARKCSRCGKPLSARNKSGLCRDCYNRSRRKKA
jgi:glycosyltransferase involved in cell wall biosynthesis